MRRRLIVLLVTGLAVAAFALPANAGPWANNVTGGGEVSYPGSNGVPDYAITFDARVDADGNSAGSFEWSSLNGTPLSYGSVDCVEVRDNRAAIVYTVEGGAAGGYGTPGVQVALVVEDNGEGHKAASDRHSYLYGTVGSTCTAFLDYYDGAPLEVEWVHGNIRVR